MPVEPVHPHACGENGQAARALGGVSGSPPRVWGKRPSRRTRNRRRAVHPHACGENGSPRKLTVKLIGSPPRVWGKRLREFWDQKRRPVHPHACGENAHDTHPHQPCIRFTPTRVGKTILPLDIITIIIGSPPRVWGKRSSSHQTPPMSAGSPPRVWGKRRGLPGALGVGGGSPPRVWGKLAAGSPLRQSATVHPHACGENDLGRRAGRDSDRFTPTRVGKTRPAARSTGIMTVHPHACGENSTPWWSSRPARAVHPHACGENAPDIDVAVAQGGSPPRVWGKPRAAVAGSTTSLGSPPRVWGKRRKLDSSGPGARFTPTRVGKTFGADVIPAIAAVHPHACGENDRTDL